MRLPATLLLALALTAPAQAEDKPSPAEAAKLRADNLAIAAADKDTDGVFRVQDDGTIKHAQSGIVCPAGYPNVSLYHLFVYDGGKGLDVGCDYRRADDKGGANAKLTIFAVKEGGGMTLDSAFAQFRNEVVQTSADLRPQGPALTVRDEGGSTFPPFRSEEFLIRLNDRDYTSDLIVAESRGWIVEIRATFTGLPSVVAGAAEADAADSVADRVMTSSALLQALGTLDPPNPAPP